MTSMQKKHLLILAKHGQPDFSKPFFPYTSGKIGPYFMQTIAIEEDGKDYRTAIDAICNLIRSTIGDDYDAISGGETKDWDFSNPVAYALAKPHVKLYKERPNEGAKIEGRRIIHVADINNKGSSIRDRWYPMITEAGGILKHVFFYVDRMEEGVGVLESLSIPSSSVVRLDKTAWQILQDNGVISADTYASLNRYMDDKRTWAHSTLKNNIDTLIGIYQDPVKRHKAEEIIDIGYPEMKDELIDRMRQKGCFYAKDCYEDIYTRGSPL
jgi:orotate phosphoribosyltransferase